MSLRRFISVVVTALLSVGAWAMSGSADSTAVTGNRGFDAGRHVNTRRMRIPSHTEFTSGGFFSNMQLGLRMGTLNLFNDDYGHALMTGLTVGKWVHPAVAVRIGAGYGTFIDNFDASQIRCIDVNASVLFNLMSYAGGYDTSRFCEFSLVGGLGYDRLWNPGGGENGNLFSGRVGLNLSMRVFDRLHLFVEPQVNIYFNPLTGPSGNTIILSRTDSWRRYVTGLDAAFGLSYEFGQKKPEVSRTRNYFVTLIGGTQFQNSSLVFDTMSGGGLLGIHFAAGGGCWYNNWFAVRATAGYSRNPRVRYSDGRKLAGSYAFLRVEGQFDIVRAVKPGTVFGLSVLAGPEMGRIMKQDRREGLSRHYIGLGGGLHADIRVHSLISVFVEPRFSLVPYSAPNDDHDLPGDNRNYFDGLLNFNIGFDIHIPSRR